MSHICNILRTILILSGLFFALNAQAASANQPRHLLYGIWQSIPNKTEVFKAGSDWLPYPAYSDRAAWDKLSEGYKESIIRDGEKAAKSGMELINPSLYLQCEKARRQELTFPVKRNFGRVGSLMLAELVEGKGRFIEPLIDALWYMSEVSTWMNPYNSMRGKKRPLRNLPDPEDRYISLNAADAASRVALAWYFFHEEFDKIDPTISRTVLGALKKNTFDPYLDETKDANGHSWLGLSHDKRVNNWNTFCNMQVLLAFLLAEQDQDLLLKALDKGMRSMDRYLDSVSMDGCCDEGPGYWDMAGGKVYDFARMMYDASAGRFDIFHDEQVKNLCEYKAFNYIGGGWVINFADGQPFNDGDVDLPFRMGCDLGSETLVNFGLYLQTFSSNGSLKTKVAGTGYRSLEALRYAERMREAWKKVRDAAKGDYSLACRNLMRGIGSVRYEGTDQTYLRNGNGWVLGAKGGNNDESHNHNDVGSALLFIDSCPVVVDLGCQVYGPDTFGPNRYTLYQNQSDWHNIVTINGASQKCGAQYAAVNSKANLAAGTFSTDVASAYPEEAACNSWVRSYKLDSSSLTVTDTYSLKERKAADLIHFVTNGEVIVSKGYVTITTFSRDGSRKVTTRISYPRSLTPTVDTKEVTDKRHLRAWGGQIHRVVFASSAKAPLKGSYSFKFTRED